MRTRGGSFNEAKGSESKAVDLSLEESDESRVLACGGFLEAEGVLNFGCKVVFYPEGSPKYCSGDFGGE